ncbi:reticulon-4 receptor-like, partial [Leucoraja erinacea]|uniref:reticulon-4 receptor-like n=1 Tax=Leucoraja erinaceus TaxID=7782 RepID=UPI002453A03F
SLTPLLLVTPPSRPLSPCPSPCTCYLSPLTVSCQSLGLSTLPSPLPPSSSRLLLQGNKIEEVGLRPFPPLLTVLALHSNNLSLLHESGLSGLAWLQDLDLGHNPGLLTLGPGTFRGLVSLRSLHLGGCGLLQLPPGLFSGLVSLRYLYLHDNRLPGLPSGTFRGLGNLSDLFLYGNRIETLPGWAFEGALGLRRLLLHGNGLGLVKPEAFSGLSALSTLFLFENRLQTLPGVSLSPLRSLLYLRLNSNPWLCDCQALGLRGWFRNYRGASTPVSCLQPPSLQGRDLRGLEQAEFGACPGARTQWGDDGAFWSRPQASPGRWAQGLNGSSGQEGVWGGEREMWLLPLMVCVSLIPL